MFDFRTDLRTQDALLESTEVAINIRITTDYEL